MQTYSPQGLTEMQLLKSIQPLCEIYLLILKHQCSRDRGSRVPFLHSPSLLKLKGIIFFFPFFGGCHLCTFPLPAPEYQCLQEGSFHVCLVPRFLHLVPCFWKLLPVDTSISPGSGGQWGLHLNIPKDYNQ